jgi:hypothetical protein
MDSSTPLFYGINFVQGFERNSGANLPPEQTVQFVAKGTQLMPGLH